MDSESSVGEKRRRQTGIPQIICKTAERRFDRLLKEDSLAELLINLKQKLRLPADSPLKLVQVIEGDVVDLEDEDDFDALHGRAHASSAPIEINITTEDGGGTSGSPTAARPKDGEPPKKRQRVSKPKQGANSTPSAQPSQAKGKAGKKTTTIVAAQPPPPEITQDPKPNGDAGPSGPRSEESDSEGEPLAASGAKHAHISTTSNKAKKVTTIEQDVTKTVSTKQAIEEGSRHTQPSTATRLGDKDLSPAEQSTHAQTPATATSGSTAPRRRGRKSTSDKPFKLIKTRAKPQTPEQLLKKMSNLKKLGVKLLKRQEALVARRDRYFRSQAERNGTKDAAVSKTGTTKNPQSASRDVPTSSMPIAVTQENDTPSPAGEKLDETVQDDDQNDSREPLPPTAEEEAPLASEQNTTSTLPLDTEHAQLPPEDEPHIPPVTAEDEHAPITQHHGSPISFRRLAASSSSSESEDDSDEEKHKRPRLHAPPTILTASAISKKPPTVGNPPAPDARSAASSLSPRRLSEASVTQALLTQSRSGEASPEPQSRDEPKEDPIESDREEENNHRQPPIPSSPITQFPPSTPRGKGIIANMKDRLGMSPAKRASQAARGSSQAEMPPPSSSLPGKETPPEPPVDRPFQGELSHDSQPISLAQWSALENPLPSSPNPSSHMDELNSDRPEIESVAHDPLFFNSETQLEFPYSQHENVLKAAAGIPKGPSRGDSSSEEDSDREKGSSLVPARLSHSRPRPSMVTNTPRQKSYVGLAALANSAMRAVPSFTSRASATPAKGVPPSKRQVDYGYEQGEEDDDESSSSEREEANAHIPKDRRAGMMGKAKR